MNLKRRWLAFCRRAGAAGQEEQAFADLDRRYREPGRHYHTWAHVASCLRELRRAGPGPAEAQALELALWFHDAVYRPGRGDNEQASAEPGAALGLRPGPGPRPRPKGRRADPGHAPRAVRRAGPGPHRGASAGHRPGGAGRALEQVPALRAGHRAGVLGNAAGGLPRGQGPAPARLPGPARALRHARLPQAGAAGPRQPGPRPGGWRGLSGRGPSRPGS